MSSTTKIMMSPQERRAAASIATIFIFRMLGLFMILPVFALYADGFDGVTPTQIGLAIGAYGLTQALLQIPYGMASDRLGRKPVILFGLVIFALGSIVAAQAESIEMIILGRAIQGAGAIAAAMMALLSDQTREEHRTKAMAMIGMSIGFSFIGAMVLGPLLSSWWGVPGIFYLTAALALLGMLILWQIPAPPKALQFHHDTEADVSLILPNLQDPQLLRLNLGIFSLHFVLTASFIALPFLLRDSGHAPADHWQLYLPVMVLAMITMVPFIIVAEKRRLMKPIFVGAILLLSITELLMAWGGANFWLLALLLWLFFSGFNLLEASLPSLVAKFAPPASRGTAMGIYSTSQFLGAFCGGVIGGWTYSHYHSEGLFLLCGGILLLWGLAAITMESPRYVITRMFHIEPMDAQHAKTLQNELENITGVAESYLDSDEGVVMLKVDPLQLDEQRLDQLLVIRAES